MNKEKVKQVLLIVFAWVFTLALVYIVYIKAKILLNNK